MNKAVIYCRVSDRKQEDGWSLDSQTRLIRDYAKKNGLEIVNEFVGQESGHLKNERQHFVDMLSFMKKNGIKNLLCLNKERLLRDFRWYVMIEDAMNEDKIKVHFVRDSKILDGTNRDDMLVFQIETAINKRFIEELRIKIKTNLEEKKLAGEYIGQPPNGYKSEDGKLVVDPQTEGLVTDAFEQYASGQHSIKTLADWLYEKGHRTRRGAKISIQTLHGILRNKVYIGLINLNGRDVQGTHKPLIKKALFEKVQKRLQETGHEHPEQGKEYYFKGLAKCGYCGRSLVAETHKGIAYYHCSRIGCKQDWIREEEFLKRFDMLGGFDQEEDAFKVFEAVKEALRNAGHIEQEEIKEKVMKIQKQIAVLEGQIDMAYDDRLKGDISADRYKRKVADIEQRQRQLRAKAEEVQETNHEFLREGMDLLDITEQIYKRIRTFDKEQLQVVTRQVLESVTAKHGELYWKYKSPFDLLFDIHRGKHPWPDSNRRHMD